MPIPTSRQLLQRHVVPFAVTLVALTVVLVANFAVKRVPDLAGSGAPDGSILDIVLLAVPFTAAMTIPMATFIAVLWVFTRLGADGTLSMAQRSRDGVRRLLTPVLGVATVVVAVTLVSNTQAIPRANARLAAALASGTPRPSDRTMTLVELRTAAKVARAEAGADASARAAAYEVEIHKKFALAAACLFLALAAVSIAFLAPRGGVGLVLGASVLVFAGYYALLTAGEALADKLLVPPVVAMWMANVLLLVVAVPLLWRGLRPGASRVAESLVTGR